MSDRDLSSAHSVKGTKPHEVCGGDGVSALVNGLVFCGGLVGCLRGAIPRHRAHPPSIRAGGAFVERGTCEYGVSGSAW